MRSYETKRPAMSHPNRDNFVPAPTHFRPNRSAKVPPVNMPKVLDISAKPCQYETTLALIAGSPSITVSAMVLMNAGKGMIFPGICCWN